ncbi:MAG: ribosome rescue protein RqcH [Methanobacteriaceae archaeon]
MKVMSNVDIFAVCKELNELLTGARVDKSFQPDKNTVIMRFHVKGTGRIDLVLEAGVRIHKSEYPLENPKIPPSFPMLLRKRLKGANVIHIKQHNFDRVVEIKFQKETTYTLIIELFSKGNIILLDEEGNIVMPLKRKRWGFRDISSKKEYIYPSKSGIDPFENLDNKEKLTNELTNIFKESDRDLIRTLAGNNLGGLYAEEIILQTGLDKTKLAADVNNDEVAKIVDAFDSTFSPLKNGVFKPNIVYNTKITNNSNNDSDVNEGINNINNVNKDDNGNNNTLDDSNHNYDPKSNLNPNSKDENNDNDGNNIKKDYKDVIPLDIKSYNDFNKKYYSSYNEAADEFFSTGVNDTIKSANLSVWEKKVGKFSKRLSLQEETLEKFKNTIEVSKKKGDLLYANYSDIENLINTVNNARLKDYSYKEIAKTLKKAKENGIEGMNLFFSMDKMGIITLDIEDTKIIIDSRLTLAENAETFYEKSKKAKGKINGTLMAIERTKKELKKIESKKEIAIENVKVPKKRVKKDLKWFEKLRWFLSSDNVLVVGGRDANSNEIVVKKYLDNNNVYMHSDIHGAPSVAIKTEVDNLNENLLKESAIFAASFSSAWSKQYGSLDVYWVKPEQVSKTPQSGEFLAKGSFVVRGTRNYVRGASVKVAIGIVDFEGKRLMAGPVDALEKHSNEYVIIKSGYTKKEQIAKSILSKINKDNLIDLDDVVRVLPSGKCDIERVVTNNDDKIDINGNSK